MCRLIEAYIRAITKKKHLQGKVLKNKKQFG